MLYLDKACYTTIAQRFGLGALAFPEVADHAMLSMYQAKRVAARRAGSTYAYDLPGGPR